MKTGRTEELIHQIADVTAFTKMKLAKSDSDAKARLLVKTVCESYLSFILLRIVFSSSYHKLENIPYIFNQDGNW